MKEGAKYDKLCWPRLLSGKLIILGRVPSHNSLGESEAPPHGAPAIRDDSPFRSRLALLSFIDFELIPGAMAIQVLINCGVSQGCQDLLSWGGDSDRSPDSSIGEQRDV